MAERPVFKDAYDSRTGAKLPDKVPEQWFEIFPNLRKTPKQRVSEVQVPKPANNERGK